MKKEMNNKGFSLVELIVVIAIMAVLVGVLAPQFLRYVERSRLQKDNQAIGEIGNAIKAAAANESAYDELTNGLTGTKNVYTKASGSSAITLQSVGTHFDSEVNNTLGTDLKLTSKTYKNEAVNVYVESASANTIQVKVDNFVTDTDGTKETNKIL